MLNKMQHYQYLKMGFKDSMQTNAVFIYLINFKEKSACFGVSVVLGLLTLS